MPKLPKYPINLIKPGLMLTLLTLFLLLSYYYTQTQKSPAIAARTSPDVIAIRVIPNHQHYSPQRWYKEQGFAGSPQSLTINGYEAIKEGRTVYVNAANISDKGTPDPSDDILYTNIYLMSYNQDADSDTIAIVNQLLQHWHFNTDLQDVGKCVDAEGNLGDVCLIDPECPTNEYCSSAKARVTRDTKRLEDLAEIKIALKAYKNKHNRYPDLSSGSYLPNNTISTWPSWQDTLANELNITLPEDPINRLGDCGDDRFNPITCWDEQAKEFADSDLTDPALNLPVCSYVYVYTSQNNGASYEICAVMESDYLTTLDQGACSGSGSGGGGGGGGVSHIEEIGNNAPIFTGFNFPTGYSGMPYDEGFIEAFDPDGDTLIWSINTSATTWTMWSATPVLESTPIENQKTVIADVAGIAGSYNFTITINDQRGGVVSQSHTITVENGNLPIIQTIADQTVTIGYDLVFTILASEADSQYPLTFNFTGGPTGFNSAGALDVNQHDYNVSGIVIDNTGNYSVTVTATDIYAGESALVGFTVTVENQAPIITTPLTCATNAKVCTPDPCSYPSCAVSATDPDSHSIASYNFTGLPPGLSGNSSTGVISGDPTIVGDYTISITATDEYGLESAAESYLLTITLESDYSDITDWDNGTGINIIPGQDWLEVSPITTPYIWVASSGSNSVYRIDTATHALAGPFAVGTNPSRTAVNVNGDVWVGNRSSANVTHLDTNGNLIKTCAVGGGPRAVAIDAAGNVWIGNYSDGTVYKLDYNTCAILENINVGGAPYGAAVDGLNNLWISNRGAGNVNKIDIASASVVFSVAPGSSPYGIAIDKNNNIWSALWGGGLGVTKINQAGGIEFTVNLGMYCRAIAADKDNNIWVTHSMNDRVTKLDNNGNVIFSVCTDSMLDCNTTLGAHPIGVTATADGYIWVVNYSTHRASKIDPNTGNIVTSINVGLQPYTYSDMAGYMLRSVTLNGANWTVNIDGTVVNPSWDTLSWTEVEPGDSYARVRVRSAATQAGLNTAVWSGYFNASPVDLSLVSEASQRWLQIYIDLHLSSTDQSPIVNNLLVTTN